MQTRMINAQDAPAPVGGYSQALEASGVTRFLFISGQIPCDAAGAVPKGFRAQAEMAWANVAAQLQAAGMGIGNLVKVTIFLSDRAHAVENRAVRETALGAHKPALTVIISEIFDSAWLLEIEAIAAA